MKLNEIRVTGLPTHHHSFFLSHSLTLSLSQQNVPTEPINSFLPSMHQFLFPG